VHNTAIQQRDGEWGVWCSYLLAAGLVRGEEPLRLDVVALAEVANEREQLPGAAQDLGVLGVRVPLRPLPLRLVPLLRREGCGRCVGYLEVALADKLPHPQQRVLLRELAPAYEIQDARCDM
jgi:hypothetical protein